MKTYYIVTRTNQEYNDEVYYFTDGGAPVRVFEGENAMGLARAKARELSLQEYNGICLWEYENHQDWPKNIFPEAWDGEDINYEYYVDGGSLTEDQLNYLLVKLPFYEVTQIIEE